MPTVIRERKSNRLVARVTPEDKALFERAAVLEGCSVGAFIVANVRTAAEKVVHQYETIRLNREESHRFVKALLAPPARATRRFKEALKIHRETVTER
jgi:uncharacterized protein (DUF1778 family)